MMIRDRIAECREEIAQAARRAGRSADDVVLIGVTKTVGADRVKEALDAGLTDIGENRVQEAKEKFAALAPDPKFTRHMIGHLQSNKARDAVHLFDLIHSVDSLDLAREIDRRAAQVPKVQDILLEVNVSGEASKFGLVPGEVRRILDAAAPLKNIRVLGLMTVAPVTDDPENVRFFFRKMKELSRKLFVPGTWHLAHGPFLSMGMSDDFKIAVEEGATHVRLGRALFGERS